MRVLLLLCLVPAPAFACAMPHRPPPQVVAKAVDPKQAAVEEAARAEQLKAIMAEIDAAFLKQSPPPAPTIAEAQPQPSS